MPAMPILAFDLYGLVLAVHLIAVVLAFGPTFAYPFMQALAQRSDPRSIPFAGRVMNRIDKAFVLPGMVVVLAAGIYLVVAGPWTFSAPWISAAFLIVGVLLVLELAVFLPGERKMIELAERDIASAGSGDVAFGADFDAVARRLAVFGGIAGLLVLIAVFLMATKPGGA